MTFKLKKTSVADRFDGVWIHNIKKNPYQLFYVGNGNYGAYAYDGSTANSGTMRLERIIELFEKGDFVKLNERP
jgi:hypothetical protein